MTDQVHQFQWLGGQQYESSWGDARAAYCTCASWVIEAIFYGPDDNYDLFGCWSFDDKVNVFAEFLNHLKTVQEAG